MIELPYHIIICDWNGTITTDRDEKPILEDIAVNLLRASIPFHPVRLIGLLRIRKRLENLYQERRQNSSFDFVKEIYRIYNQEVISGISLSFIQESVSRYAKNPRTQAKLDPRILKPVRQRHQAGKTTGILSSGYEDGIAKILRVAGYEDAFDFIQANPLKHSSKKAEVFLLNIYKNKQRVLLRLFQDKRLTESHAVYIGDSQDDEGCFEVVTYPVVAFLASDDFKQRCASKYGAFVPESENNLREYLERI